MAEHAGRQEEPETPAEVSRRSFLAQATVVMGGAVGVTLAVTLIGSLVPTEEILSGQRRWSPLERKEFEQLGASNGSAPLKLFFTHKSQDGYLVSESRDYVWGLRLTPAQEQKMRTDRPDLFAIKRGEVPFSVVTMGFVIFSPICPHLGCHFNWDGSLNKFLCPCHGSVFSKDGKHLAGPAPRGLDPLPMREQAGTAEITWIQYEIGVPERVIVAYS